MTLFRCKNSLQSLSHFLSLNKLLKIYLVMIRIFMGGVKSLIIQKLVNLSRLLRGEVSTKKLIKRGLTVGNNFSRQGGCRIDTSYCHLITIGDDVGLAPNVVLLAHDNSPNRFTGIARLGRINIGSHVFVGAGTIILPNVTIGDNVIIGAGSVVSHDIPSNCVVAGNPASVIRPIDEFIEKTIQKAKQAPVFENESYSALNLNDERRREMKEKLAVGAGYFKTVDYGNFKSLDK